MPDNLTCEKCGKTFTDPKVVPGEQHGWPFPTGEKTPDGKMFKMVLCASATPEQVADYHKAKAIVKERAQGSSSRGFPKDV